MSSGKALRQFAGLRLAKRGLATGPTPRLFYFNRLFLPAGMLHKFIPAFLFRSNYTSLKTDLQKSIGAEIGEIVDVTPRPADGGAFVSIRPVVSPSGENSAAKLRKMAADGIMRRWLFFNHRSRGFEVRGRPWINDIPRSISRVVRVDPPLPQEDVYDLLRPYGHILRISENEAKFASIQDAVTATYCAHRTLAPSALATEASAVTVRLSLLPRQSLWARLRSWLMSHPRIVIPAMLALAFGLAYAVFEPVRELSVCTKIRGTLAHVAKYVEFARNSGQRLIPWSLVGGSKSKEGEGEDDGSDIGEFGEFESNKYWNKMLAEEGECNRLLADARLLRTYIEEGSPTFTVVVGPKGSGKTEALDIAVTDIDLVLDVDCDKLRGVSDEQMLQNLASAVGYWPLFLWTNNVFKALEVGIQGLSGQTTAITETTDEQANRILTTTAKAIRRLALRHNERPGNEGAFLEAHPEELPVVVLHNFSGNDRLAELLAQWAGDLTRQQIARVVFVAQDANSYDKTLSAALPNRVFRTVNVEDVSPRAAKDHVLRMFTELATTDEAREAIDQFAEVGPNILEPLGGRFTDLQSFGRHLLNGESPERALRNLVHSAALEASQLYLNDENAAAAGWTVEQAWEIVKLLSQSVSTEAWLSVPGTLAANPVVSSADSAALEALALSGMISLRSVGGRITGIKAARPLFRSAFRELVNDPLVSNIMEARIASNCMQSANSQIEQAENELVRLAAVSNPKDVRERQEYVVKSLADAQARLVQHQKEHAVAISTLKRFGWYEASPGTATVGTPSTVAAQGEGNKWFGTDKPRSCFD